MGSWRGSLIGIALALALTPAACACGHKTADPPAAPGGKPSLESRAPGEYLVTLADGAEGNVIDEVYGRFGIKSVKELGRGIFLVVLGEDPGPASMEELRARNASVKAVQPNFVYRTGTPGKLE